MYSRGSDSRYTHVLLCSSTRSSDDLRDTVYTIAVYYSIYYRLRPKRINKTSHVRTCTCIAKLFVSHQLNTSVLLCRLFIAVILMLLYSVLYHRPAEHRRHCGVCQACRRLSCVCGNGPTCCSESTRAQCPS